MVVETRYVAGNGVLLGTGHHWLLLAESPEDSVVDQLWRALNRPGAVTEKVTEILDQFDIEPSCVLLDLTPGASQTLTRGAGSTEVEGPAQVISVGTQGSGPSRRLIGGVVAAARAEITLVTAKVASTPSSITSPPPPAGEGLIDGIPASILAARGPDGPPPPRPRRETFGTAEDTGSRGATSDPAPVLAHGDPTFSSSAFDATTFPDPEPAQGTSTVSSSEPDPPQADDHDGSTVVRSGTPDASANQVPDGPEHLRSGTNTTVMAVNCPSGHPNPPERGMCRICRASIAPQNTHRIARPVLGGLRLPTGEVVPLDRGVVLGRKPAPLPGSNDWPHLVHLSPEHNFVSRLHLAIELDGWQVIARDLGSRGGTTVRGPGGDDVRLDPNEPWTLEPGQVLTMAGTYPIVFEVPPKAMS